MNPVSRCLMTTLALGCLAAPTQAAADPGPRIYPGMTVWQGATRCVVGFVEPSLRIAMTSGGCDGESPVTDSRGGTVGAVVVARHNITGTAALDGSSRAVEYEAIGVDPAVAAADTLPDGRRLRLDPASRVEAGAAVCVLQSSAVQRCGHVTAVGGGRFTMADLRAEQAAPDGGCGPVYTLADDGRATIVGLCDGADGAALRAESWRAVMQQLFVDTRDAGAPQPLLVGRVTAR